MRLKQSTTWLKLYCTKLKLNLTRFEWITTWLTDFMEDVDEAGRESCKRHCCVIVVWFVQTTRVTVRPLRHATRAAVLTHAQTVTFEPRHIRYSCDATDRHVLNDVDDVSSCVGRDWNQEVRTYWWSSTVHSLSWTLTGSGGSASVAVVIRARTGASLNHSRLYDCAGVCAWSCRQTGCGQTFRWRRLFVVQPAPTVTSRLREQPYHSEIAIVTPKNKHN